MERNNNEENAEKKVRVRLPRENQLIGVINQRVGGNKMFVDCLDGKTRNCRVPGRLRRKLWLRPGDIVLIELWELDRERGDVIFKYSKAQSDWLKSKGYLEQEKSEF
jgi:translation initiation factor 1A